MMSLRAIHAGSGYQYLLRSVATNDAPAPEAEAGRLADYYQAKGTPPGRWLGAGLPGLTSETAKRGEVVEADQMAALYGLGMHPDTHAMLDDGKTLEECKLGGKFPVYTNDIPVLNALREAENAIAKNRQRLLTDEERGELAASIGHQFYVEETGYANAPDRDVIAWVNEKQAEVRQAVAGFDMTFSPAKSISVLWALADERTASAIAACHHEAVAEVMAWAEDNVIRTRMGRAGLAQVRTNGIVAAEFTHFDTRTGDPDLHSHVLVSNRVQGPDGKWRTLDSRAVFKNHQTLSARYDMVVQEILARRMGLEFVASSRGEGKEPVWEVAGVPQPLIDSFSKRRGMARPVYERLLAKYVDKHGHQPDSRAQKSLWQSAILDTRDAKKPAESLHDLRDSWREEALRVENGAQHLAQLNDVLQHTEGSRRPSWSDVDQQGMDDHARVVIDRMVQKRSYFARHHVTAAVASYLKGFSFADNNEVAAAFDALTERIIDEHLVDLTRTEPLLLPRVLQDEEGKALDRHLGYHQYTTATILAQEDRALSAVEEPVPLFAQSADVDAALSKFEESNGFTLNTGQAALAKHLLQAGTLMGVGVGPAGTGKTTSMQIVADVWQNTGRKVVGLAPSAAAAQVLGTELDIDARTIDSLSYIWRGRHPHKPGGVVAALPIELSPGDMLLVDEAGMATTDNIAALTEIAEETGAIVRMIGDPHQLDAVGTSGLFSLMCNRSDAAELTDVMRFSHGHDTEQAEASLQLRDGDTDATEFYRRRGWLEGGTRETMLADAVHAYLADLARGRNALVLASNNADVDVMNEMIRTHRISTGEVDESKTVTLSRGDVAGVGDIIIARQNQRLFTIDESGASAPGQKVINGQLFEVINVHDDGGLTVGDVATDLVFDLPTEYVSGHTHLGYASTVHRAQGATVDVTHSVIDSSTSRSSLYVALTRGKRENRVYAVTDAELDEFAEIAHDHSAGSTMGLEPEDVLARAITRDLRQKSATEIREEAADYAASPERLVKLYRFGLDQAYREFLDAHLPAWLGMLTVDDFARLDNDGVEKIRSVCLSLLECGRNPNDVMASATFNLESAEDVGAVIAYRLRMHADIAQGLTGRPGAPPPRARGSDPELMEWLWSARDHLTALDEPETRSKTHDPDDNQLDADRPTLQAFIRGQSLIQTGQAGPGTVPSHTDRTRPITGFSPRDSNVSTDEDHDTDFSINEL